MRQSGRRPTVRSHSRLVFTPPLRSEPSIPIRRVQADFGLTGNRCSWPNVLTLGRACRSRRLKATCALLSSSSSPGPIRPLPTVCRFQYTSDSAIQFATGSSSRPKPRPSRPLSREPRFRFIDPRVAAEPLK